MVWLIFPFLFSFALCGRSSDSECSASKMYPLFVQQFIFELGRQKNAMYSGPEQIQSALAKLEREQFGDYFHGAQPVCPTGNNYCVAWSELEQSDKRWKPQPQCQLYSVEHWSSILERAINYASQPKWADREQQSNELAIIIERKMVFYRDFLNALHFSHLFISDLKRALADNCTKLLYPSDLRRYPRYVILKAIMSPRDEEEAGYLENLIDVLDGGRFYLKAEVDLDSLEAEEFVHLIWEYLQIELSMLQQKFAAIRLLGAEEVRNFMRQLVLKEIVMRRSVAKKRWLSF